MAESSESDNMNLLVKRFGKYLKSKGNPKRYTSKHNESNSSNFTCYNCGKQGHIKIECPNANKEKKKSVDRKKEKKPNERRAYIAWEDNDDSTTSSSSQDESEEANLCLMAGYESSSSSQVIKGNKKDLWYLDSGCSRHMTRDKTKFAKLELKEEGFVTYGDNNKGRIRGSGVISNGSSFSIKNVLLVEGLKHNLISISQLCDKGFKVMFEPNNCFIYDVCGSIVLIGKRVNNIYLLDMHHASFSIHCLLTKEDDTWLWHRRLCHIHMHHFNRLN